MPTNVELEQMIVAHRVKIVGLTDMVNDLVLRMSAQPGAQCSADLPHPDGLVYLRGPDHYACRCGMLYKKDGKGSLEVKI